MGTIVVFRLSNGKQIITFDDVKKPDGVDKVAKAFGLELYEEL